MNIVTKAYRIVYSTPYMNCSYLVDAYRDKTIFPEEMANIEYEVELAQLKKWKKDNGWEYTIRMYYGTEVVRMDGSVTPSKMTALKVEAVKEMAVNNPLRMNGAHGRVEYSINNNGGVSRKVLGW